MTAPANHFSSPKSFFTLAQITLIVIAAFRFVRLLPDWVGGVPPAYPGQYEGRLLFAITIAAIGGATLLAVGMRTSTRQGRIAYWALLAIATAAMVVQMVTGL